MARLRLPGGRRAASGVLQEGQGAHGPVHAPVEGGQRNVRHDGRLPQGCPPHRQRGEDVLGFARAGSRGGPFRSGRRTGRERFRRRRGTQGGLTRARAGRHHPGTRGPAGPEPRAAMRRDREAQIPEGRRRRSGRRRLTPHARGGTARGTSKPPRRRRRPHRGRRRGEA